MKWHVKLQEYLDKKNIKDSPFGRSIGKSPAMVGRYKRGLSKPGFYTALKIQEVTNQHITMKEMGYAMD